MAPDSLLHPMFEGLLVLSGLQGLGKTRLAMTAEHPKLTYVMDLDLKGSAMARAFGITEYHAPRFMTADTEPTEYEADKISEWAIDRFKHIPPGITTLVIDNATALELGLGRIVEKNPTKYGLNAKNVAAGIYGGVNPGISILWANITTYLQSKGVKLIIMINHMTQPWAGGAPVPNRFHVKGNKIFRQLSIGTFILVPGETARGGRPPAPSALVIKESLALNKFSPQKGHSTQRALPMRIPVAEWPNIKDYFEHPANFEKPAPGETWTMFELNAFGEFLSPEQLQWIKDAAKIGFSEEGGTGEGKKVDPVAAGRVRLLKELPQFKSMDELAAAVRALPGNLNTYSLEKHEMIKAKLIELKKEPV